ncbi:predicted protein [Verticillium alfalfae VaMs.102]|uniref:Predicted protein n=1 Tax=Verticillium alfalfae (strain VaMs.102 / ATCC MYA-4576 / FGSC 10136) TaxID=526221 RepID=C9SIF9_VERA1|nr:predicted protein [Verticillium alfalfae VaMs.102]EEY18732.1 predicted protein [Verticillium alfalfae VaMs.102]
MYDRVKAVEAKASIDSAARQQAERAMGALEKEMTALQAMVAKSQPDPSEHMRVEDLEKELRQKHEKMIEMVSEFNTQRESLLADVNRLVDQTRQIQQDVTARSISITEEPIVPSEDLVTYPGEAAAKVATTAMVPEKSVEAESIEPAPADDISTASESGSEPESPRNKGLTVDRTSTEKARSANDNVAEPNKVDKVTGRKLRRTSSLGPVQSPTRWTLRSAAGVKSREATATGVKLAKPVKPLRKQDTRSKVHHRLAAKSVERRTTERNQVIKQKASDGRLRRLAFTRFAKFIDAKARAEEPPTTHAHKLLIWEFIDGLEDKEMSSFVQSMLLRTFPELVVPSKGRGKPFRRIILEGRLEWYQVLEAIKSMPVPPFFLDET